MQAALFEESLEQIVRRDPRYHREAYFFVRQALDHTQKAVAKEGRTEVRHVSGQELLEGIRQYAAQQYGPMAPTLFDAWGVHRCADFGEIVFNMVECGLLAKTDKDTREDFKQGYNFDEAFCQPYLPSAKKATPTKPEAESTQA